MQELTGQYSHLFTRKFLFSYKDFQPSTSRRLGKTLFQVPNGFQVVHCMLVPKVAFAGVGVTTAVAKVYQANMVPAIGSNVSTYITYNAMSAPATYAGVSQWQQPKLSTGVTPQVNFINDKGASVNMGFYVEVNAGASMNSLTAGEIYVYVTYMRIV